MQSKKVKEAATKALREIKEAQQNDDTECAHGDADDALCDLLSTLGFSEIVTEYHKVKKWFA